MSEKRLSVSQWQKLKSLPELLSVRVPPPDRQYARVRLMERDEFLRIRGHHHIDVQALLREPARDVRSFVGRDRTSHAQDNVPFVLSFCHLFSILEASLAFAEVSLR